MSVRNYIDTLIDVGRPIIIRVALFPGWESRTRNKTVRKMDKVGWALAFLPLSFLIVHLMWPATSTCCALNFVAKMTTLELEVGITLSSMTSFRWGILQSDRKKKNPQVHSHSQSCQLDDEAYPWNSQPDLNTSDLVSYLSDLEPVKMQIGLFA